MHGVGCGLVVLVGVIQNQENNIKQANKLSGVKTKFY